MPVDMERIEAMSDEELTQVSTEHMVGFISEHTSETFGIFVDDMEDEIRRIMRSPDLIGRLKECFYRTVRNRQLKLKETKEHFEAMERSSKTGSVKDRNEWLKADFLCFDLKNLSPRQLDALFRFIDDDPDLGHGYIAGQGTIISVEGKSMTSGRSEQASYDRYAWLRRLVEPNGEG